MDVRVPSYRNDAEVDLPIDEGVIEALNSWIEFCG